MDVNQTKTNEIKIENYVDKTETYEVVENETNVVVEEINMTSLEIECDAKKFLNNLVPRFLSTANCDLNDPSTYEVTYN